MEISGEITDDTSEESNQSLGCSFELDADGMPVVICDDAAAQALVVEAMEKCPDIRVTVRPTRDLAQPNVTDERPNSSESSSHPSPISEVGPSEQPPA